MPATELDRIASHWDAAVDAADHIDPFCTSSLWSFSAAASFPDVEPPVVVTDGRAFVGLRATVGEDGTRLLLGLDPVWGFATPVVGDPRAAPAMLVARTGLDDHDVVVLTGQRDEDPVTAMLIRALQGRYRIMQGPVEQRLRADLTGGFEQWWSHRSPRFRRQARSMELRADDDGVTVVDLSALPPDQAMARVLDVEHRSWKGTAGTGLAGADLAEFTGHVLWRLAAREQLRLLVACRDGIDVGYVLGGVRDRTYRGIQISYAEDWRHLGIGHLLQLAQMRMLEGDGIDTYDLGMDIPYKRRWADRVDESYALVLAP